MCVCVFDVCLLFVVAVIEIHLSIDLIINSKLFCFVCFVFVFCFRLSLSLSNIDVISRSGKYSIEGNISSIDLIMLFRKCNQSINQSKILLVHFFSVTIIFLIKQNQGENCLLWISIFVVYVFFLLLLMMIFFKILSLFGHD